ncbi:MAG: hypothetical protein Q8755_03215, partial [Candidatus Phytoplasma australasiaticum]|nr:hypothetical protein [Candidatus Phytoplasma australasiaticum]
DPAKVEAMTKWNPPKTQTKFQSFLGLVGYYRRFNQEFSRITTPLTKLTKKGVKFEWGSAQNSAFKELRRKLTQA